MAQNPPNPPNPPKEPEPITGPWTEAGLNLQHYFGSLIDQVNVVQNDMSKSNARLRAERNFHREQAYAFEKKTQQIAGVRLVLEQKVLRLEESLKTAMTEKNQMSEDFALIENACKQLREVNRGEGLKYERLVSDLSKSENELYSMKRRFTNLTKHYRKATGEDPPACEPSDDEDGPDSYLQKQKRAREQECKDLNGGLDEQKPMVKPKAPERGDLYRKKFATSQQEAIMEGESQKRNSPMRQTRSKPTRKDLPLAKPAPKTNIVPPPPILNLDGATIVEPVVRNERSKKTRPCRQASATAVRSPNKAEAPVLSAHMLVETDYASYLASNAQASTLTSHQPPPLLPAAHIKESYQVNPSVHASVAPKTSSANHGRRNESTIVRKHVKNIEQRRKQLAVIDQAEAHVRARSQRLEEDAQARRVEHRDLVVKRRKELQKEMDVDLGDFPPAGEPLLKDRWRTLHVGKTQYAPKYVTPEPIVKAEEGEGQIDGDDEAEGSADQQSEGRRANSSENVYSDRNDEGEDELYFDEIAGDGERDEQAAREWRRHELAREVARYREARRNREESIGSGSSSRFMEEDDADEQTHRQFIYGDAKSRYAGHSAESSVAATNGSHSKKSKRGERDGPPEERIVNEVHEQRPTKRRRMAAHDPVPGPSNHQRALPETPPPVTVPPPLQYPLPRRTSVRLSDRRVKAVAEARKLTNVAQYVHDPAVHPRRRGDGRLPIEAFGTAEDIGNRQLKMHRMHMLTEAEGLIECPEPGFVANFIKGKPGQDDEVENVPVTVDRLPPLRKPPPPKPNLHERDQRSESTEPEELLKLAPYRRR